MKTVTVHAVEQFIKRWRPKSSFFEANTELNWLLAFAKPAGKTFHGDSIFVSGNAPEIRMVVKNDYCVTVLPASSADINAAVAKEELELFEELKNLSEQSSKREAKNKLERFMLRVNEIENNLAKLSVEDRELREKRSQLDLNKQANNKELKSINLMISQLKRELE